MGKKIEKSARLTTRTLAAVATLWLLVVSGVSCTKGPDGEGTNSDNGQAELTTIDLQLPGAYSSLGSAGANNSAATHGSSIVTRALTNEQENTVTEAMVLVYDCGYPSKLLESKTVYVSDNKLKVKLATSQTMNDLRDIVVIGNPRPAMKGVELGTSKDYLQQNLFIKGSKWDDVPLVMWGERQRVLIRPINNIFKIDMLRSLARLDLGVGLAEEDSWQGLADFALTEVSIYKALNTASVIPLAQNVDTRGRVKVTAPSIPGSTTSVEPVYPTYGASHISSGTIYSHGSYVISSTIFLAEAPDSPADKRVSVIVGGLYKGSSAYYRIDMVDPSGKYLPILRNHRYKITITAITGAGASSKEEASTSPAINIKYEIDLTDSFGNDNGGDIIFDDNSYIRTDVSEVQIWGNPDGVKLYDLATITANGLNGASNDAVVHGPGIPVSGINVPLGIPLLLRVPIPALLPSESKVTHTYTISYKMLKKPIQVTVQRPLEGARSVVPFSDVASITTDSGIGWVSLSHNANYVPGEQKQGFIEGNADGRAYLHIADNLLSADGVRTTRAIVTHNNHRGNERLLLEQELLRNLIGYFGGNPALPAAAGDGTIYPKRLAVATIESASAQYKTSQTANDATIINSIYYGRQMNVAAEALTNRAEYPAFRYCANLNTDSNGNGKIDDQEMVWYLPSQNQLMAIWVFHGGLDDPFGANYYWSATQSSEYDINAWAVYFSNGYTSYSYYKTNGSNYRVRCVRDI